MSDDDVPTEGEAPEPPAHVPGPYPGGSVAPIPHVPPNDVWAVWSLVFGILGVLCCGLLAAIPAIVFAVQSKKRIAASGGEMRGDGLAQAGFILGVIGVALQVIGLIVVVILTAFGN